MRRYTRLYVGDDMWGEPNNPTAKLYGSKENAERKNKWRMTWIIMKCVGKSMLRKEGTKRSVLVISMGPYD